MFVSRLISPGSPTREGSLNLSVIITVIVQRFNNDTVQPEDCIYFSGICHSHEFDYGILTKRKKEMYISFSFYGNVSIS